MGGKGDEKDNCSSSNAGMSQNCVCKKAFIVAYYR